MNQTSSIAEINGTLSFRERLNNLQQTILENPSEGFSNLKITAIHLKQLYQDINKARCAILAIAEKNWDKFPLTETNEWDHDFYRFAREFTGGYTIKSINNMKQVGATWLNNELPPGIPEKITLYDDRGSPVVDKNTGEVIEVEPDPFDHCNFSKLLVATGAAHDGRLANNDIALGQLFNPEVGVRNLSDTLQGRANYDKEEIVPELFFILEGPYLIAKRGPEEVLIAELNLEAAQGEFSVGNEGLNKLKRALNL